MPRALCRRLRDGLSIRAGCTEDVGRPSETHGEVSAHVPRRKDPPDRVRPVGGARTQKARSAATGDVRISGLHPLLWLDPGRAFRGEA